MYYLLFIYLFIYIFRSQLIAWFGLHTNKYYSTHSSAFFIVWNFTFVAYVVAPTQA